MIRFLLLFPILLFSLPWTANRGPIDPYISGDTFRSHADFVYDEISRSLNPKNVGPNAILFTNGDFLDEFFREVHPHIESNYILIVHNTDRSIPGIHRERLDDPHLLAMFAQNIDCSHPKLHPLPIGVENRQWNAQNKETLERVKARKLPKTQLLYCNFARATYPEERDLVDSLFGDKPYTLKQNRKPYLFFVQDLARSKFVLAPRGNGLDTHRLWETLYVGSYPIVKSSPLDPLYTNLPVIVVDRWEDLDEQFLREKYEELSARTDYEWERLTIDFYLDQMRAYQK